MSKGSRAARALVEREFRQLFQAARSGVNRELRQPSERDRQRGIVRKRIERIEDARRLREDTEPFPC